VLINARSGQIERQIALPGPDALEVRVDATRNCAYALVDLKTYRIALTSDDCEVCAATSPFQRFPPQLSASGDRLPMTDRGQMVLVDVDSGARRLEIPLPALRDHRQNQEGALSPSGRLAALSCEAGRIDVFNLDTGARRTLTGEFPWVRELQFHPSDRYLALTEHYGETRLRVLSLETGEEVTQRHVPEQRPSGEAIREGECWTFDFSPDGRQIAVRDRDRVLLYDWDEGRPVVELRPEFCVAPNREGGFRLLFNRDSRTLLVRTDLGVIALYRCSG
jgi:WD40 repeat protein